MKLRTFQLSDTDAVVDVYRDAIRRIGPTKYSPEEVAAWARHPADVEEFGHRLARGYTLVAEEDSRIHAFGQVEPRNCFAFLYTTGTAKTKCLGAAIYDAMEAYAYADGVIDMYAEASRISLLFCLHRGFTVYEVIHQNHFGVELEWYRMIKTREAALSPSSFKARLRAMRVHASSTDCSRSVA
ncbi:MAG: GNAT family N-acetyltransferase [Opitutaceae bacterium]|jgi:hypothetical protein